MDNMQTNDIDSDDVIEITSSNDQQHNMSENLMNRRRFNNKREKLTPQQGQRNFINNRSRRSLNKNSSGNQRNEDFHPNKNVDKFEEKLFNASGPTYDLPPIDESERKFSGKNRLYIGNIGNDFTEQDIVSLFEPFGEFTEIFISTEKSFGFVKMDYHCNAEKAKRELEGKVVKNRVLRVRLSPSSTSIKVKNLTPFVTNELLHFAFSLFGEVEKAKVLVDERGKSIGEGIVDFVKKGSATYAIQRCNSSCYFITNSLQPVIVEPYEAIDDSDSFSERNINKKSPEFMKERQLGPRMPPTHSFEHEYAMRWKALFDLQKHKEEALRKEFTMEKEKLEAQMEYIRFEHETEALREQLRIRELDKERQKREWESKQRQAEEEKLRYEELLRRQQKEIETRMASQQEASRRRLDENNLLLQAHNLNSLLDFEEQAYVPTPKFDVDNGLGSQQNLNVFGNTMQEENMYNRRGHWVRDNKTREDFQNKRRRF